MYAARQQEELARWRKLNQPMARPRARVDPGFHGNTDDWPLSLGDRNHSSQREPGRRSSHSSLRSSPGSRRSSPGSRRSSRADGLRSGDREAHALQRIASERRELMARQRAQSQEIGRRAQRIVQQLQSEPVHLHAQAYVRGTSPVLRAPSPPRLYSSSKDYNQAGLGAGVRVAGPMRSQSTSASFEGRSGSPASVFGTSPASVFGNSVERDAGCFSAVHACGDARMSAVDDQASGGGGWFGDTREWEEATDGSDAGSAGGGSAQSAAAEYGEEGYLDPGDVLQSAGGGSTHNLAAVARARSDRSDRRLQEEETQSRREVARLQGLLTDALEGQRRALAQVHQWSSAPTYPPPDTPPPAPTPPPAAAAAPRAHRSPLADHGRSHPHSQLHSPPRRGADTAAEAGGGAGGGGDGAEGVSGYSEETRDLLGNLSAAQRRADLLHHQLLAERDRCSRLSARAAAAAATAKSDREAAAATADAALCEARAAKACAEAQLQVVEAEALTAREARALAEDEAARARGRAAAAEARAEGIVLEHGAAESLRAETERLRVNMDEERGRWAVQLEGAVAAAREAGEAEATRAAEAAAAAAQAEEGAAARAEGFAAGLAKGRAEDKLFRRNVAREIEGAVADVRRAIAQQAAAAGPDRVEEREANGKASGGWLGAWLASTMQPSSSPPERVRPDTGGHKRDVLRSAAPPRPPPAAQAAPGSTRGAPEADATADGSQATLRAKAANASQAAAAEAAGRRRAEHDAQVATRRLAVVEAALTEAQAKVAVLSEREAAAGKQVALLRAQLEVSSSRAIELVVRCEYLIRAAGRGEEASARAAEAEARLAHYEMTVEMATEEVQESRVAVEASAAAAATADHRAARAEEQASGAAVRAAAAEGRAETEMRGAAEARRLLLLVEAERDSAVARVAAAERRAAEASGAAGAERAAAAVLAERAEASMPEYYKSELRDARQRAAAAAQAQATAEAALLPATSAAVAAEEALRDAEGRVKRAEARAAAAEARAEAAAREASVARSRAAGGDQDDPGGGHRVALAAELDSMEALVEEIAGATDKPRRGGEKTPMGGTPLWLRWAGAALQGGSGGQAESRWWEGERALLQATLAESEAALQAMEAQLGAALELARTATQQGQGRQESLAGRDQARHPSVSLAQLPDIETQRAEAGGAGARGGVGLPAGHYPLRSEDGDDGRFSFSSISTAEIEAHQAPPAIAPTVGLSSRLGEHAELEEALRKRGVVGKRPPAVGAAWRSALQRVSESEPARDSSPSGWVVAAWHWSVEALTAALAPPPADSGALELADVTSVNFRAEAQREEMKLDALQREGLAAAREVERRQRAVRDLVTGMAEKSAAAAAGAGAERRAVQLRLDEAILECDRLRRKAREREAARAEGEPSA